MRKVLIPLLLCLLLLCGCAAQTPQPGPTLPASAAPMEPEPSPVRDTLEMTLHSEDTVVQQYTFSQDIAGFLPLGDNLLLFSGTEPTLLTLADPNTRQALAVHEPDFVLTAENATVQRLDQGLSYFNGAASETILLDEHLREIRRIPAPGDLSGMPLLSRDGSTLYYCTPSAIRALDLDSGISRVLKEAAYPVQSLSGLLLADSVLQLSITDTDGQWRTLFLSAENGRLLQESAGNILPETGPDHYLLQIIEAVKMAKLMNIPILGIIENMSYYECPDCGKQIKVFGDSHIEEVAERFGYDLLARIPMDPKLSALVDKKTEEIKELLGDGRV